MTQSKPQVDSLVNSLFLDDAWTSTHYQQMIDSITFQTRFMAMVAASGCRSRSAFADHLGVSKQVVQNWYGRDGAIPQDRRRLVQEKTDFSIDWVNEGIGPQKISYSRITVNETRASYVRVEQLDGEADMGDGIINEDFPDVIRAMDFADIYIRNLIGFKPPPGRLKLLTGRGNSMVPVIEPGDVVVVDTGCQIFDGDGVYLINTGNGQQIKALQDRGDAVYVVSANAQLFPPFPVPSNTLIGGKVYLRNRMDRLN